MLALARRRLVQTTCLSNKTLNFRGYAVQQPSGLDEGEQNIHKKLNDTFDPVELAVQDVSGASLVSCRCSHVQSRSAGGCGTFYAISIASEAFRGLPTVKQHRLVNEVLKKEIEGIHGLQVRSLSRTRVVLSLTNPQF